MSGRGLRLALSGFNVLGVFDIVTHSGLSLRQGSALVGVVTNKPIVSEYFFEKRKR